MIKFETGTIQFGAKDLAPGLYLTPDEAMQGFGSGTITSVCAEGSEADIGRLRLTFYSTKQGLRLTVDAGRAIVERSASDCARKILGVPLVRRLGGARQSSAPPLPTGEGK